jgi:hypothetical protein
MTAGLKCTLATLTQLLGYQPAPGATIVVPAAWIEGYSAAELSHAKSCVRRLGFSYRIVR